MRLTPFVVYDKNPAMGGLRESFVYVMHDGIGAKIGVAECADTRRKMLQCGNPRPIEIKFVSTPLVNLMAYAVERTAHRYLNGVRLEGEWFAIGPGFATELVQKFIADMLFGRP